MPPKSGHQRAKNIDYDDDGLYSDEEYYEEESGTAGDGMTDEDKEQMRICTGIVREALDSGLDVTDAQIQESLWHYYYDVDKTVTYLKSKSFCIFKCEGLLIW
jgi:elongation factor 1 alpha-like protein